VEVALFFFFGFFLVFFRGGGGGGRWDVGVGGGVGREQRSRTQRTIVGTNPTVLPSRLSARLKARISSLEVMTLIGGGASGAIVADGVATRVLVSIARVDVGGG
jgi:hypothetical protein